MRRILWIGLAVMALPGGVLSGQAAPTDRDAVVAALRHLHKDFPSAGKIALLAGKALSLSDTRAIAAMLGAELFQDERPWTCGTEDGHRTCRFRGVVGALLVSQVEPLGADRMKVRVWTHVEMNVSWRPPWLYGREYEVELARERDGTWIVMSSAMLRQT